MKKLLDLLLIFLALSSVFTVFTVLLSLNSQTATAWGQPDSCTYTPLCYPTSQSCGPCADQRRITLCNGGCSSWSGCTNYYLYGTQPTSFNDGCYSGNYRDYYCSGVDSSEHYYIYSTDLDGDGYNTQCGGDCNDNNPFVHPGAVEVANGIDDNCNSQIDEGFGCVSGAVQSCGVSNIGACKLGNQTCINGQWSACTGNVSPTAETCNSLDDNCNGLTDENLYQQCGSNIGICQFGQQQCASGAWGVCLGGVSPTAETCNSLDDNCNGLTDENRVCNQAPVIQAIPVQNVFENQSFNFAVIATDPDNDIVTITASSLPSGSSFSNITKLFAWKPNFTQAGIYFPQFTATDFLLNSSANATINVSNLDRYPSINPLQNKTGIENQTLQFNIDASDPDNDTLVFTAINLPAGATFNTINATTGAFSWTPSFSQSGYYNVTFNVTDGILWNEAVIFINISDINTAPAITIFNLSVYENNTLQFTLNVSDQDNSTISVVMYNLPSGAVFANATKLFNWTPNFTQAGYYNITINATDGINSTVKNFTILVNNTNQIPVLINFTPQNNTVIAENQSQNFTINITDLDNEQLAVSWYKNGTSQQNYTNSTLFVFLTDFTSSGLYNITVSISDAVSSIFNSWLINVTNVNVAPIINTADQSVYENNTLSFIINITEPDNENYTINISSLPFGAALNYTTSGFNWTPNFTQAGYYNITINATDGNLNSTKTIAILVNNTDRAPAIFNYTPNSTYLSILENQSQFFEINATDPDNDALTFNWYRNGTLVVANGTNNLNFTSNYTSAGIHNFTAIVSDGNLTDRREWSINVTNLNLAPVLNPIGNKSVPKTFPLIFAINASDADNDNLTFSASNLPVGAVFNPLTRTFSWTPSFVQIGVFNVTFNATDGMLSTNETIFIAVQDIFISQINSTLLADAYVSSRYQNTVYGNGNLKLMDYSTEKQRIYLKFNASPWLGKQISSAVLTLNASEDYGNNQQKSIYFVSDDNWTESTLTWNNRPDNTTLLASNTSDSFAFSSNIMSADSAVTLMLQFNETNSYAKMTFGSKEIGVAPSLLINFILNDSNPPAVSLLSPANNSVLYEQNMSFSYIVTDESIILNCSLLINSSAVQASTNVQSGVLQSFSRFVNNGSYNWNVQCIDSFNNSGNAVQRTFLINGTPPLVLKNTTIYPVADAYVSSRYPGTVFNNNYLKIMDYPIEKQRTYIKFNTAQFVGKNVTNAVIYLIPEVDAGGNYNRDVYLVTDDSWSESTITWNTKPAGVVLIASGAVNSFNVLNSNFTSDGMYSMLIRFFPETDSYAKIIYGSKEVGTSPYIIVNYYDLP